MHPLAKSLAAILGVMALAATLAQAATNRTSVTLSDPARPGKLIVKMLQGSLSVTGYDGKAILVHRPDRAESKRNPNLPATVKIEEENNVVTISCGPSADSAGLEVSVPYATSLKLNCINEGNIRVEHVEGELEANCLNGSATLRAVSGVVLAHSLNGDVTVQMNKVTPGQPMSFSTLNGEIDVTLPPNTQADLLLETQNGMLHHEFQERPAPSPEPPKADRRQNRQPLIEIGKHLHLSLNGGGAEIRLKTFNGSVHLRKGKP